MIAASKEKINRDNARSHSAKYERESPFPHRVCPSKLTKQELEDLYFVLMDTNLDLKKTVNTQQDNIKQLNTKVHRLLTAQRGSAKEQCCPQTKAVVNEQRDIIADLKKANDRMSDRIRILNMRLCSAKQFLKSNQSLSNARCAKCCIAPPASLKNSSVSVLHTKKNDSGHKPAESSSRDTVKQVVTRDYVPTRTTETATDEPEKESPDACCKENKCKTQMEELKQKIIDLQEESSRYHNEYSARISRLESEMSELHAENERVKLERAHTQHSLDMKTESEAQLAAKLRAAGAHCNEISSQLLMEKNKVAELETRVRAADLANQVAKALEKRQSISFVGPDPQPKSSGLVIREIDTHPSTSTCIIHTQDKSRNGADATMAKDAEHRPSTSYIESQNAQPKRGEQTKDGEKRQSISFLLDPTTPPKSEEMMGQNDERKASIHLELSTPRSEDFLVQKEERKFAAHCGTTPISGDRMAKEAERHHSITIRVPLPERTPSAGESLKLEPNGPQKSDMFLAQNEDRKFSDHLPELPSPSTTSHKPCPNCEKRRELQAPPGVANSSSYVILGNAGTPSPVKSKHSDDSGYNDNPTSEEEKVLAKINAELVKKIKDLQEKLDILRVASAGLKAEQMTRGTETKKSDVDPKIDDSVKNEKLLANSAKTSRDSKTAPAQDVENERKKEIPIQPTKDSPVQPTKESPVQPTKETESPEYSPIDRANQLWAQYSGNTLPQKEDKIQFSNLYRQFNSVDKIIPTPSEADPDKDSMTSRSSRRKRLDRKKLLDDKYVDQNELVDKIEMDNGPIRKQDSTPDFPFYEFKPVKSQCLMPDDKARDSFTTDNVKADDRKRELNSQHEVKNDIKLQDSDAFRHEAVELADDSTQTALKTGVKIQDNNENVFRPVDKQFMERKRTRDSVIDKAVRDKIIEIRNFYKDKQHRNTSDDDSSAFQPSSEICEQSVRICSCPRAARRRSVSVFRSCSGTLRFKTTEADDTFRQCRSCTPDADDENGRNCYDNAAPQCKPVNDARPRTASPDNTDHEISHLSDLPPEHDVSGKSPRNLISPGEQKMTPTTCTTDSCTEPASEMPTMSEGEVLVDCGGRRRSIGETKDEAVGTKAYKEAASVSQMMEQALLSIGEELARCRELLQNTRPPEIVPETRETSTTCPSRVALKHSAATPQLVQPLSAPCKCTFTLHIGTLVLSDEAVVYSRDKSLLLTWKFYDQSVAMTRVRGGRVILFDFTTEYDAILDERFTDYLKYEEMPIVICELEKQNFPFATCSLPLRDVLINPNHRVDMSLALTVGPDMRKADVPLSVDSLVTSDEVGVLDLWCMLRNKTSFSEATKPTPPRDSGNAMMDIRSEEFGMSVDDKFSQAPAVKTAPPVGRSQSQLLDDNSLAKYEDHIVRLSSVIPNEVPTKIRRRGEMEKAIDEKRNEAQSNESIKGLEKLEDDVLSHQPHQSISSWARFLRRQSKFQTNNKKSRKNSLSSTEHLEAIKNTYKPHAKGNKRSSSETEDPLVNHGAVIDHDQEYQQKKAVTMNVPRYSQFGWEQPQRLQEVEKSSMLSKESIVITILWLALNEECGAMTDCTVQRLYVAFSLLGRSGADLETPFSLPKPRSYVDKCIFNFRKSIQVRQCDLPQLGHLGRCSSSDSRRHNPKNCVVFTVISEPAEDPLGLANCEDIGYAYLYLGDVLSASDGDTYVEVIPVHSARRDDVVCGVLCVQVDGLELVRKAKLVNVSQ